MSYKEKPQIKLFKYENDAFKLMYQVDDYESCSWQRTKYEAGTFTIDINYNIPNSQLFEKGMFVQFGNDSKDFGFIQNISDSIDDTGKGGQMRSITGYDCRYLYKRRIIRSLNSTDVWTMTDSGELCMRNLIADQCGVNADTKRRLPITNTIPSVGIGNDYTVSEAYSNLYDVLVTIAIQSECMWFVEFVSGELVLNFYEGHDLSSTVRLDTDYESLKNGTYDDSFDSFSNAVYVGGQGSGSGREIYEGESSDNGNSPSGFDRFESWDDCSTLTTEEEYETEATSVLNEYAQTLTLTGAGLAKSPYVYKEQYDVGDIVSVKFNDIETTVTIQSVTEHWMKGSYDMEFEFGKPVKDLTRQLELLLSKIQNYQATGKASSTTEIKYYTIPTDTEMESDEVTYTRIGFKGTIGANGNTFKLYKNGATGVKSYHVYVNQLATNGGKLTLTTGTQDAENLVLDSGTYVVIIYVDENGNVKVSSSSVTLNGTESASATIYAPTESGTSEYILKSTGSTPEWVSPVFGAVCSTAKSTTAKTVTVSAPFVLSAGAIITVCFTYGNSALSPTLNVNGTGAKNIMVVRNGTLSTVPRKYGYWRGSSSQSYESWQPYTTLDLIYNGSYWVVCGNPVVESYHGNFNKGYHMTADGLLMQWDELSSDITSEITFQVRYTYAHYYLAGWNQVIPGIARISCEKKTTGFVPTYDVKQWSQMAYFAVGY